MTLDDDPVIVPATSADTGRLAEIIRSSFADVAARFGLTPLNCPKHPSNCTQEWIEKDLARGVRYFVLNTGGLAVGCVGVEPASESTCYMERLAVLPAHRGKGYGTRLARQAIQQARALGAAQVGIGIMAVDAGLQRFYNALGFEAGATKTFAHLPFEVMFMHTVV